MHLILLELAHYQYFKLNNINYDNLYFLIILRRAVWNN